MLLNSETNLEKSLQPSLTWDISPLFAAYATEYRRASFKLRQNYLKSQPSAIFGGFHNELEYFDVDPNPTVYSGSHRFYPTDERVLIVFEKSEESIQMTDDNIGSGLKRISETIRRLPDITTDIWSKLQP